MSCNAIEIIRIKIRFDVCPVTKGGGEGPCIHNQGVLLLPKLIHRLSRNQEYRWQSVSLYYRQCNAELIVSGMKTIELKMVYSI
jgi:hypothetical protein